MTEDEAKAVRQLASESYYRGSMDVVGSLRQSVQTVRDGTLLTKDDMLDMVDQLEELVERVAGPTNTEMEDDDGPMPS